MSTFEELSSVRPATPEELQRFVAEHLGMHIPGKAICPGHQAPLDYLSASFLGQEDLLVWANRGGGKTQLAAVATFLDAVFHAPAQIRVLGGSFDQSDRLADYVRQLLERHEELVVGRMTRGGFKLAGGSAVRVLAQSQRAVRGQHVQKIRCDEVDLFDADVWRAVQFSTHSREGVRGSIEVLSTLHRAGGLMNELVTRCRQSAPADAGATALTGAARASQLRAGAGYRLVTWCLWEVIERCPPTRECSSCGLREDCKGVARQADGFFPIDDAIAFKARSSRRLWEAEMLCLGVRHERLVLSEFSPSQHVREMDVLTTPWDLYRAIDFGYQNPFVCLWIAHSPSGHVHIFDEYSRSRITVEQHAREVKRLYPQRMEATYVDPSGGRAEGTSGKTSTQVLGSAGIPCQSCASTIADGLELIRSALAPALGEPRLTISPRCVKLIAALNSYHYPEPGSAASAGAESETPVKDGPDHMIDALRYFFINRMKPGMETRRKKY